MTFRKGSAAAYITTNDDIAIGSDIDLMGLDDCIVRARDVQDLADVLRGCRGLA
jgi:hypothetical protein